MKVLLAVLVTINLAWTRAAPYIGGDALLIGGDMLLTREQFEGLYGRSFTNKTVNLWLPEKEIPYMDSTGDLDTFTAFLAGVQHWEEHTCLTFKPVQDTSLPYVNVIKDSGCYSYVGNLRQTAQNLSLGAGCLGLGTVAHEIGHAAGSFHEHSRSDRDDHVTFIKESVNQSNWSAFHSYQTTNYDVPYDYYSVLHYHRKAFSMNDTISLRTSNPFVEWLIGQRFGLSFYDIKIFNVAYGCIEEFEVNCDRSSSECLNEGFLGKNCACVCPAGTAGQNCEVFIKPYEDAIIDDDPRYAYSTAIFTTPGVIASPGFPNLTDTGSAMYPVAVYVYEIRAPECHEAVLHFTTFDHNENKNEYVEVRDTGASDPTGIILKGTNAGGSGIYKSTNQGSLILYGVKRLYANTNSKGWEATVSFEEIPGCSGGTTPTPAPVVTSQTSSCLIKQLTDTTYTISNPQYPADVPTNYDVCTVDMVSDLNYFSIQLNRLDSAIGFNYQAAYETSANSLNSGTAYVLASKGSLNFYLKRSKTGAFLTTVSLETSPCHLSYELNSGDTQVISMSNYPANTKCEYLIENLDGSTITLAFSEGLNQKRCSNSDHFIISRTGDIDYTDSVEYCDRKLETFTSNGSTMRVVLNGLNGGNSFSATITAN